MKVFEEMSEESRKYSLNFGRLERKYFNVELLKEDATLCLKYDNFDPVSVR